MLAIVGLSSFARMRSRVDHMSDMMKGEDSNFMGAIELKQQSILRMLEGVGDSSYRVRLGWRGDINEDVRWGIGVSSNLEQPFSTPGLVGIHLEQAYISYMPMDGLMIKAGKYGWRTNFNKTGVLYDDDLFAEGISLKYRHQQRKSALMFKLALHSLKMMNGPFAEGAILKAMLGGKYSLSRNMMGGAFIAAEYDGLFKDSKDSKDSSATPLTLAKAGFHVGTSYMNNPVGFSAVYLANVATIGEVHSYTVGVHFGNASAPNKGDMNDFGVSVSYFDLDENNLNADLVDTDYIHGGGKGIAVRGQYNVLDNTSLVAKFSHDLGEEAKDANNLVAELTFNF